MTGHAFLALVVLPAVAQDTVTVVADGDAQWGSPPALEQVAEVGSIDGAVEYTLGLVVDVAIGEGGSLLVADAQGPIRRYSSVGTFLGTVGRRGQGPGEYMQVLGIESLPDGRIAVWDPLSRRLSLFSSDGDFENSFPVWSGYMGTDVFDSDSLGRVYIRAIAPSPVGSDARQFWLRHSANGTASDTVAIPPGADRDVPVLMTSEGPRRPYPLETVSAVSQSGNLVWGHTSEYVIYVPRSDGSLLRVERPHATVQVGRGERRQWGDYFDYFAAQNEARGRDFIRPTIPDVKPPFRGIMVDDDDRIWVSLYAEAYEADLSQAYVAEREGRPLRRWREPPVWEVLSSAGAFLGRVSLPPRTRPVAARGERLIVVRAGEYDEQYVTVYRLPLE